MMTKWSVAFEAAFVTSDTMSVRNIADATASGASESAQIAHVVASVYLQQQHRLSGRRIRRRSRRGK